MPDQQDPNAAMPVATPNSPVDSMAMPAVQPNMDTSASMPAPSPAPAVPAELPMVMNDIPMDNSSMPAVEMSAPMSDQVNVMADQQMTSSPNTIELDASSTMQDSTADSMTSPFGDTPSAAMSDSNIEIINETTGSSMPTSASLPSSVEPMVDSQSSAIDSMQATPSVPSMNDLSAMPQPMEVAPVETTKQTPPAMGESLPTQSSTPAELPVTPVALPTNATSAETSVGSEVSKTTPKSGSSQKTILYIVIGILMMIVIILVSVLLGWLTGNLSF